jgi:hypothetical protein
LFAIGWLFAGFSVVGQPHVMVRFMALDGAEQMGRARAWYYGWFTVFYAMATGVGLMSRLLLPETGSFDSELALPTIALELLPDLLVGVILAGIFAATMSTADSLILSCAGSLTEDLPKAPRRGIRAAKLATIVVTLCALGVALFDNSSVFVLVVYAWAGLGAAFGPLLTGYALGYRPDERLALGMVGTGVMEAGGLAGPVLRGDARHRRGPRVVGGRPGARPGAAGGRASRARAGCRSLDRRARFALAFGGWSISGGREDARSGDSRRHARRWFGRGTDAGGSGDPG